LSSAGSPPHEPAEQAAPHEPVPNPRASDDKPQGTPQINAGNAKGLETDRGTVRQLNRVGKIGEIARDLDIFTWAGNLVGISNAQLSRNAPMARAPRPDGHSELVSLADF
jgi:hypothetical protein